MSSASIYISLPRLADALYMVNMKHYTTTHSFSAASGGEACNQYNPAEAAYLILSAPPPSCGHSGHIHCNASHDPLKAPLEAAVITAPWNEDSQQHEDLTVTAVKTREK